MIIRFTFFFALCTWAQAAPASIVTSGLDNATITLVRANLLTSANASWELGTATHALLELDWPELSLFQDAAFPPISPYALDEHPVDAINIVNGVLASKPPGTLTFMIDGSAGDPASLGVAFLVANLTRSNMSNTAYWSASGQQLDLLLHDAPRTSDGAISHRTDQVQLWSDFVFMAPPFIAYLGALQGGPGGAGLIQYAYDQCRLYRDFLRDEGGLWRHVVLGDWEDDTHWATGNGWAAAGMLRVLASMNHSAAAGSMSAQQANLTSWIGEIVSATWTFQQPNGTLLNTLDVSPDSTFADTAGTALLAAATLRLAALTGDSTLVPAATQAMALVNASIDADGWLRGTVDPYTFAAPSAPDAVSPEGQAFVILMQTGWRDYLASLVSRLIGR